MGQSTVFFFLKIENENFFPEVGELAGDPFGVPGGEFEGEPKFTK